MKNNGTESKISSDVAISSGSITIKIRKNEICIARNRGVWEEIPWILHKKYLKNSLK